MEATYPVVRWRPRVGLVILTLLLVALAAMGHGYLTTQSGVTFSLDGHLYTVRTHQTTVAALLDELGIQIEEEDIVLPSLQANLRESGEVIVQRARPVALEVDGQTLHLRTHTQSLADLLREARVTLSPQDQVMMEGLKVDAKAPLLWKLLKRKETTGGGSIPLETDPPLRITIRRAIPLELSDDGVPSTVWSVASTVGQALNGEGVAIYLGDRVHPNLGTALSTGLQVYIQRAKPVTILADGRRIVARTQAQSVVGALREEGLNLVGKDYTIPPRDAVVADDMTVKVIRVQEEFLIEEEPIPFETVWAGDPGLEIDQSRLNQKGEEGLRKRLVHIVYENGQETQRFQEEEWVAEQPTTEVIAYGTNIVLREVETPKGTARYWRKMRVLVTSYTAATSGKPRDHPQYGITYLGWEAKKGVIAVDPQVINLGTKIYVPGYGVATAADTGGAIKGRHIDLAYAEDRLKLWHKWVDVYLLEPAPPPEKIRWILPSWPPGG